MSVPGVEPCAPQEGIEPHDRMQHGCCLVGVGLALLGVVAGDERAEGGGFLAQLPQVVEILQVHLLPAGSSGFQLVVEIAGNGLVVSKHSE